MSDNLYIGVMSGTSLDGIDIALCSFDDSRVGLKYFDSFSFDETLKSDILKAINGTVSLKEIGSIDDRLGQMYAKYINEFLDKFELKTKDIKAIGLHGQTLWHEPNDGFSMQIGNPNRVACDTKIAVVCDIRRMDMASGGQGAPFAPLFHKFMLGNTKSAVVNIGGMANISILGDEVIGYDTGCGNVLMDSWCSEYFDVPYDKDGLIAKDGNIDTGLLDIMLDDDYFKQSYPKSTGREYFNMNWVKNKITNKIEPKNILRTLTELTAVTIANEAKKFDCERLVICGGGVKNIFLIDRLRGLLPKIDVVPSDEIGASSEAMESMMMAYFAYLRINKIPAELKSVTGAKENLIAGGLYEPN